MTEQHNSASQEKIDNEKTGRLAGAGAGVVAGAQVGTVLLPIPIIGTFTGALVGGVIGSKIGKRVGSKLLNTLNSVERDVCDAPSAKQDLSKELERLVKLREQGVLDEAEFRAAKAKLLGL